MAKIIKKENQLEKEYYAIRQKEADKRAKNLRLFCKAAVVTVMIYCASIIVSIVADVFLIAFIPLTMCLGFGLLIAVFVCLVYDISESDTDILAAGINGERVATEVLSTLPADYTVQLLKGQALNQFLLKKTGITWDSVSIQGAAIKDLRNDSFDIFREQAVKSKRMDEPDIRVSNEQLLDHLNLINEGQLTRAAILLFHHNPEKWIPGAYVKIAYFQTESDILYQDEVHGSLLSQADRVVDLIYTKYLKGIISYQNITRVETYPYPKEAIREAVLNAISHKNYATLVPIQIRVYDDRIMIANDCVFPDDWSVDDLMESHKSRPYNPLIANTFFRAGFVEAWGRGIQKIKDSCVSAGNDIPQYKVKREDIAVTFKSLYNKSTQDNTQDSIQDNTQDKNLTDKERQILSICKEEKSKQEIANLMGYRTIKSIKPEMDSLLKKGKLKMSIPDKPKSKNQKYIVEKDRNID